MARALRIEYPDAWYHVMNRGIAKQNIFNDQYHFFRFLELLEEAHQIFQIEIHAYCLMNNHYHLFIKTPFPNLSKTMRHINGLFAQSFNKSENRDGPLFKGRFKAILVDSASYFLQISRYIHLNPVEAKIVKNPEDYEWSSYKYFIDEMNKPKWLYTQETLSQFQNNANLYEKFVLSGVDESIKNFYNNKIFPILGSDTFIKNFKNHKKIVSNGEQPDIIRIIRRNLPSINEVIKEVSVAFNITSEETIKNPKKGEEIFIRNVVIYISSKTTGETHKSISDNFSGLSRSAISQVCFRMNSIIKNNTKLMDTIDNIIKHLLK